MCPNQDKIISEAGQNFALWRVFNHTNFMITRLREKELFQYGLTPEQAYILDILAENNGSSTINDMVDITQRQHHTISTQIDRMAKQGLVTRKKIATDKRKYEVAITNRGQTLRSKISRDSINMAFSCLSNKEKKQLEKYMSCLMDKAYELHGITPKWPESQT